MNQYRVSYGEDYVLHSVECYRRQRHVYPWFIVTKVLCALGLSLLLGVVLYGAVSASGERLPLVLIAVVLSFFLLLLAMGPRIDYFFLRRRLRRSPFYGDEMRFDVSDLGVKVETPRSETHLKWSAFTKAKRLGSGNLVFSDPKAFYWWPDAALISGAVEEVGRLLESSGLVNGN